MEESRQPIKPRIIVENQSKFPINPKFPKNTVFKMHNVMMGRGNQQMVSVPAMGMEKSEYGLISMDPEDAEAIHHNDSSKRPLVMREGDL